MMEKNGLKLTFCNYTVITQFHKNCVAYVALYSTIPFISLAIKNITYGNLTDQETLISFPRNLFNLSRPPHTKLITIKFS